MLQMHTRVLELAPHLGRRFDALQARGPQEGIRQAWCLPGT